jgi:hypothetical protein
MNEPKPLSDVIVKTALPKLEQFNALQAKEPVTEYTATTQIRIAVPKNGEEIDQSCFEQLWVATARDGSTLTDWRHVPTQEARIASQTNQT